MTHSKIAIILVEPENPDNVGAVARAMKNMCLSDLRLVKPVEDWKEKGQKLAVAAVDVLLNAAVFSSPEEAVNDLNLVIGTTRRGGPRRGPFVSYRDALKRIGKMKACHKIGIMFGKESKGLDNHSLSLCDCVTTIPVNPDYPSINLAQAVMIMAFALYEPEGNSSPTQGPPKRGRFRAKKDLQKAQSEPIYVSNEEVRSVLDRMEESLKALDYEHRGNNIIHRIRFTLHRLFKRSGLLKGEAQMFKGLARRICEVTVKKHLTASEE